MVESNGHQLVGEANRVWPVALFTSVYLVGALITAVRANNDEFLFYIGVVVLLMGVVWVIHGRVALTSGTLWCLKPTSVATSTPDGILWLIYSGRR